MITDFTETEEKIRELVPRLMELSFGCKIITGKDQRIYKYEKNTGPLCNGRIQSPVIGTIVSQSYESRSCGYGNMTTPAFYCVSENNNSPWRTPDKITEKVIGHPIRLEDVLEALQYSSKENGINILNLWEYGKDFSQQEDKTKLFIKDLLK